MVFGVMSAGATSRRFVIVAQNFFWSLGMVAVSLPHHWIGAPPERVACTEMGPLRRASSAGGGLELLRRLSERATRRADLDLGIRRTQVNGGDDGNC